jgi:hypothetical protein
VTNTGSRPLKASSIPAASNNDAMIVRMANDFTEDGGTRIFTQATGKNI